MAEGFLNSINPDLKVYSAGTEPEKEVSPKAISVMKEVGIDISHHRPKSVDDFLNQDFDYVITVCDHANESCPVFMGKVRNRLHIGFEDPAKAKGTEQEILDTYRSIRDRIKSEFDVFYRERLLKSN